MKYLVSRLVRGKDRSDMHLRLLVALVVLVCMFNIVLIFRG